MPYSPSVKESELAHVRAAAYGLIAHGFQYPDGDVLSTLIDPRRWEDWPAVLHNVDRPTRASLRILMDAVDELAGCSDSEVRALQHRYDDLFGHAVRGPCPAYEMEYGRHEIIRQASDLADLAGFYRAFGLEPAAGANGRPDHITAECEFMSALCSKEAHAHAQDDKKNADICLDAQRAFLRDHLARWLPALAHRVQEADGDGWFGALTRFADAFVKAECSHFDIHAGPPTLELKPTDPVLDRQISCGPADCGTGRANEQLVQLGMDTADSEDR